MDKISVIVPIYNNEKYIGRCLDSIIKQDYKNLEVIVVNDGSTDNSQVIIDKYVKKYPDLIKSYLKENGGVSLARKFGFKHSTGTYISFVDSDDFIDKSWCSRLYKLITLEDALIAYGRIKIHYNNTFLAFKSKNWGEKVFKLPRNKELIAKATTSLVDKLFHRSIVSLIDSKLLVNEDLSVVPFLYAYADKIVYDSNTFYNYCPNKNGVSNTLLKWISGVPDAKSILNTITPLSILISRFKKDNLYDTYKDEIECIYIRHIHERIRKVILCGKKRMIKKELINILYALLYQENDNWMKNPYYKKKFFNFEKSDNITYYLIKVMKSIIGYGKKEDIKLYTKYNTNELIKEYENVLQ